jgi:molybdenum cofactor cytidylyltransferase
MIAAVILAAGRSSRMGRPKALLPHRSGETFVAHLIRQARLAGLTDILVIGREDDDALRVEVARADGTYIVNPEPERGQLSSLVCALAARIDRPDLDGLIVMPVDVPLISAAVILSLLESAATTESSILRAVHRGQHGHPVLFKREVFDELRSADPSLGARAVVRRDPTRLLEIEVEDPAVTWDVDTPEDYERLLGRRRV